MQGSLMLDIGGTFLTAADRHLLRQPEVCGVILFSRNIEHPQQVRELCRAIRAVRSDLLIAVDQEGGRVQRLRQGFVALPAMGRLLEAADPELLAEECGWLMAWEVLAMGIDFSFAPVLDLNYGRNSVIGLRSFAADADTVVRLAGAFLKGMQAAGMPAVGKHFPGHGSSLGDSHLGFVDVTQTWSERELEPYQKLIASNSVSMIMSAHVYNAKLDATYPATLSYTINSKLLREKMHYNGVLISDDLQMEAISKFYTLKDTVTLAINSGIDMLLFGNQLSQTKTDEIVETIMAQVKNGAISLERIIEANERIARLNL